MKFSKIVILILLAVCSLNVHAEESSIDILNNSSIDVRRKILRLRDLIDESPNRAELLTKLFREIETFRFSPSMDAGDERFDTLNWYPIAKAMLPYESATPLFVNGALQNNNSTITSVSRSALSHQKRFHGIDATHLLNLEAEKFDGITEEFAQITELIESLARVQIVPKELVVPLSEQEPSIEELMLERKKKREKELHRRENVQHRKPPQRFTQEKNTLTSDLPISQEPNAAGKESSKQDSSKRVIIVVLLGVVIFLLAFKIGRFIR